MICALSRRLLTVLVGVAALGLGACVATDVEDEASQPSTEAVGMPLTGGAGSQRAARTPSLARTCVVDALAWLAAHQDVESGHWSAAGFHSQCGKISERSSCDGAGNPQHDVGVTALALLAFLGAGQTHTEGEYRKTVEAGLEYLVDVQAPNGNFGTAGNERSTYDHMIATLAMAESYALTKSARYEASARKALEYVYAIRRPGGAWRYAPPIPQEAPGQINDTSVTAWAVLAITLAREYALPFDEAALADAMAYLDEMTDPESGITGYDTRGGRPYREQGEMAERWPDGLSEATTAAAVLCRIFADPELAAPGNRDMVEKGVRVIAALPPVWDDDRSGRRDFHFWYFGTYALYQHGGSAWDAWAPAVKASITAHQRRQGDAKGSWDPQGDPWGATGGRVYSTAMLALTLEVFHAY